MVLRRMLSLLACAALVFAACRVQCTALDALKRAAENSKKSSDQGSAGSRKQAPAQPVTHETSVVRGTITVRAGGFHDYPVNITAAVDNARITGRFTASGGSGNDIVVLVLDQDAFTNWSNGHEANALYSSGQTTTDNISARLSEPGTYHVVFSNRFSTITSKDVSTEVTLKYEK